MKAIPWEFQHEFVVADIDKKIRNVVRKTCIDVKIRKQFEEKVIELVDSGMLNLWRYFKDGVFKECDVMCGKKGGGGEEGEDQQRRYMVVECRCEGGNIRKKGAHKVMCRNSTANNNNNNNNGYF